MVYSIFMAFTKLTIQKKLIFVSVKTSESQLNLILQIFDLTFDHITRSFLVAVTDIGQELLFKKLRR